MKRSRRLISTFFLVIAAAVTVSCATENAAGPSNGPEFKSAATRAAKRLAKCSLAVPAFVRKTIGSSGGTIGIGKDQLVIPSGALIGSVSIRMQIMGDSTSSVHFQPQGLVFLKPATLTLDYNHCTMPAPAKVAYTTDQGQIIEILPSTDDRHGHRVSAPLNHFSRYAVAW